MVSAGKKDRKVGERVTLHLGRRAVGTRGRRAMKIFFRPIFVSITSEGAISAYWMSIIRLMEGPKMAWETAWLTFYHLYDWSLERYRKTWAAVVTMGSVYYRRRLVQMYR
jgi:hypothetical protein